MRGGGVLVPSVDHGAADLSRLQCVVKCFFFNHRAAPHVHQHRIGPHGGQRRRVDQTLGVVGQRQADHHRIGAGHEGLQTVQRPALVHQRVADGASVGHMHPHAKSLGAVGHGLRDVSKPQQAQGLRAHFGAQRRLTTGPKRPLSLAQVLVSAGQRHMAHQQSRHHVFGDRVLVPKAIGQRAVRGQQGGGDGVGARRRRVEQTCLQGLGHGAVELNADHHVRGFIQRPLARLVQAIAQVADAVLGPDQGFKTLAKVGRILAVENDVQWGSVHGISKWQKVWGRAV